MIENLLTSRTAVILVGKTSLHKLYTNIFPVACSNSLLRCKAFTHVISYIIFPEIGLITAVIILCLRSILCMLWFNLIL